VSARPTLILPDLDGPGGNAFRLLGLARAALREAGRAEDVERFVTEATAGDYRELLAAIDRWFRVVRPAGWEETSALRELDP
jgi:hypothetical protein